MSDLNYIYLTLQTNFRGEAMLPSANNCYSSVVVEGKGNVKDGCQMRKLIEIGKREGSLMCCLTWV